MPSFRLFALIAFVLVATAAGAQQARTPHVGYLMDRSGFGAFDEAFVQGLRQNGYVLGQNVAIEYRWTEGKRERLPALAADLVNQKGSCSRQSPEGRDTHDPDRDGEQPGCRR